MDNLDKEDGKIEEKTMAERAKEIGRDGAYLELEAKDMISAYRSGELAKAKIVVLKTRVELSLPEDVGNLMSNARVAVDILDGKNTQASDSPIVGMTDEQASTYVITGAVSIGLKL